MLIRFAKQTGEQYGLLQDERLSSRGFEDNSFKIDEVVLLVPEFFNGEQRELMVQIGQLAGFEKVHLINELTAVAISFAAAGHVSLGLSASKQSESQEHVLFFGVGAASVSAAMVRFSKRVIDSGRETLELRVLNTASNRNIGGRDLDYRIATYLADLFEQRHQKKPIEMSANGNTPSSVRTIPKVMEKLLREAQNVNEALR